MELWDILDENRQLTGRTIERGKPMNPGDYHLVVFAYIKHADGRLLISKRTPNKTFPNTWEVTGGSAVIGDDSYTAIKREVKEELGIDLKSSGQLIKTTKYDGECSHFSDIWFFEEDIDMDQVVCQSEEVSEAKLATKDDIKALIEEKLFMSGNLSVLECLDMV
ncbi:MAG: NUDIX domain-containing protein [Clostridiales bacterium]|nr:NUDIX domain-containing protein [Clostridiales bacterium]